MVGTVIRTELMILRGKSDHLKYLWGGEHSGEFDRYLKFGLSVKIMTGQDKLDISSSSSYNGLWNMVSAHSNWIKETIGQGS